MVVAGWNWISQYKPYVGPMPGGEYKDVAITYPILYDQIGDSVGLTFEDYESGSALPSIFLLDQTGMIHIREDGVENPADFELLLAELKTEIENLLDN